MVDAQDVGCSGNFFVDEEVLRAAGASDADIAKYSMTPGVPLMPDFYVGEPDAFLRWRKAGEMMAKAASLFK